MVTGQQEQIEPFLKEVESNPNSISALNHLAQHYSKSGDYTKAIQYYEKLSKQQEDNGKVWVALGHCYLIKGEYSKCFGAYQKSLANLADTKDPQLWYGIGLLYNKFDTHEYAQPAFQSVLTIDPNFPKKSEIMNILGNICMKTEQYENANDHFQQSLDIPGDLSKRRKVEILTQMGNCYELKGEAEAAIEQYKKAVQLDGQTNFKVYEYLGYAYYKQNRIDDAIVQFEKALELVQDNTSEMGDIHYLLALSHLKAGAYAKCQASFQNAVHKNPNSYVYWVSIGVLYALSTQPHDAFECFIKASNLQSDGFETWFNMAILYEQCKQKSEAILSYQRVHELNSEYKIALERKQALQSTMGDVEPPLTFIHPAISIGETTFSANKPGKGKGSTPDLQRTASGKADIKPVPQRAEAASPAKPQQAPGNVIQTPSPVKPAAVQPGSAPVRAVAPQRANPTQAATVMTQAPKPTPSAAEPGVTAAPGNAQPQIPAGMQGVPMQIAGMPPGVQLPPGMIPAGLQQTPPPPGMGGTPQQAVQAQARNQQYQRQVQAAMMSQPGMMQAGTQQAGAAGQPGVYPQYMINPQMMMQGVPQQPGMAQQVPGAPSQPGMQMQMGVNPMQMNQQMMMLYNYQMMNAYMQQMRQQQGQVAPNAAAMQPGMQGMVPGMPGAQPGMQGIPAGMQGLPQGLQGVPAGVQGVPPGMQGIPAGMAGMQAGMQGLPAGMQIAPQGGIPQQPAAAKKEEQPQAAKRQSIYKESSGSQEASEDDEYSATRRSSRRSDRPRKHPKR